MSPNFRISASCLDYKRLGKQRVEAKQILEIIIRLQQLRDWLGEDNNPNLREAIKRWIRKYKSQSITLYRRDSKPLSFGFSYHPVIRAWFNHTGALKYYVNCHIDEWISRGYNNTMKKYYIDEFTLPEWIFNNDVYRAYWGVLKEKDPEYYSFLPESDVKFEWSLVEG